jgi:hypothetical protein
MIRMRIVFLVGAIVALASAGARAEANATEIGLIALVRPACTMHTTGTQQQGMHPGVYKVVVKDTSKTRYFRLSGPGVGRQTTARFVGTRTWRVYLRAGKYRFSCAPRGSSMRGSLTVTA